MIQPATDALIDRIRDAWERGDLELAFSGAADQPCHLGSLLARLDAERARAEKAERERDAAIAELGAEGRRRGQAVAAAEADAAAARKAARHYHDALYRIAGGSSYADDPWDIARFALKFGEKQQ